MSMYTKVTVKQDDFGFLVGEFIRATLRPKGSGWASEWIDAKLREWWPQVDDYYQRRIISAIEVAIILDEHPRDPLEHREMWEKIVADLRPPRSPFTVAYHCHTCKATNVKLWRQSHTFADNIELQCASCLAPEEQVDDEGRWQEPPFTDKDGKVIYEGHKTDQVKGRVPAVPVGDTYWGYTSVPSQDVEWWVALPTYQK